MQKDISFFVPANTQSRCQSWAVGLDVSYLVDCWLGRQSLRVDLWLLLNKFSLL